jgi:hypothetical protein
MGKPDLIGWARLLGPARRAGRARRPVRLAERGVVVGYGEAVLIDTRTGVVRQRVPFRNLITDAGDLYIAQKIITGIAPANPAAPTALTGMKLGTGATAVAKSGAGAALVTYLTGSNVVFDATYPQTQDLGAGLGENAVYRCTWAAGVATNAAITEVVAVNDAATNATSTAPNTASRALFGTAINKTATDSLAVTWTWKSLGA